MKLIDVLKAKSRFIEGFFIVVISQRQLARLVNRSRSAVFYGVRRLERKALLKRFGEPRKVTYYKINT